MGVQGLWELLAPVGRRVSVETLSGKKLAIDASIWIIQFMKAMRDERGEMVRNAHLLGFFRRICKLLFLRAKPVFVFDGGTPALKRRTVAARRRHRENARAKIRKTAEKLLLNHLKSKRLEELAEELKAGKSSAMVDLNGKQAASVNDENPDFGKSQSINQESLDELLAASIAAEEEGKLGGNEPVLTEDFDYQEEDEDEEDDDNVMIFPVNSGDIDPAVLASLPPSLQLDLLDQMREKLMAENRQKYQKIKKVPAKFSELQIQSYLKTVAFRREINEVQKCASGRGVGGLQTSRIASEANREYIFSSSFTGDKKKLTPTGTEKNGGMVNHEMRMPAASDESKRKLFASPSKPSVDMSSDAVTRDYTPDVETYLDDRGRVRVSRVRGLGIRMTRDLQRNLDLMKEYDQVLVKKDLNKIPEPISDNAASSNGNSQTNDTPSLSLVNEESSYRNSTSLASNGLFEKISRDTGKSTTIPVNEAAIEISFSEDENGSKTMVDCFFMNLVSENTAARLFSESIPLEKNMDDVESECIWEDGVVGEQSSSLKRNEIQLSFAESKGCEEVDVEWEEGTSLVPHSVDSVEALSWGLLEEEADLKEAIRRSLEDNKSMQSLSAVPVGEDTRTIFKDQNSLISVKNDLNIDVQVPRAQIIDSHNEHLHTSTVLECRFEGESILEDGKKILSVCNSVGLSPDIQPMEQCNNLSLQNDQFNIASNQMVHEPNLSKTDDHALKSYTKTDFEPCCNKFDFGHGDALNDYVAIQPNHTSEIRSSICSSSGETLDAGVSKTSLTEKRAACNEGMEELANKDTCKDLVEELSFKDQASILEEDKIAASDTDLHDEISLLKQEREYLEIEQRKLERNAESCNEGMLELANKDTCKDPVEGLSFKDQASILEEDKIAASDADLHDEISLLKQEREYLGIEQRKLERNAESVSSEMFAECQELLQMFGLPYIIAPMEAEAQCAYMEMTNFVDGIVTDDSDVFLFGARNVFKNIFDDRKYVETYFMKDIENELGLSRDKLIRTALLLGSDYTEGVSGIGIVNAIEVINAFSEKDGLLKFKNWVESPDPSIFGLCGSKHGGNLSKRSSITNGNAADGMETNIDCSKESDLGGDQSSDNDIHDDKVKEVFMDKHRNVSKNWHFPPSFPSESVVTAYIYPQIDESTEPFTWGKPDLPLLRKMCWEKFGWPIQKADELLVPVLKEYNKHETQLRMEAFYSFNERFAKIRSQRIKKAVKGIVGTCSSGLTDIADGESSSKKKKRTTLSNNEQSQLENDTDRSATTKKKPSKKSGKATESQSSLPHGSSKQCGENVKRGQMINTRVKGRGRGKRKQDEHSNEEFTESTSIDESSTSKTQRSTMPPEFLPEMRRSTRHRKQVNYAEDDAQINELHVPDKSTQEDYMHSGSGFCLEGNELHDKQSRPVTIPMAHSFQLNDGNLQLPSGDGNSSSCLFTGGGFCIDESDPGRPDAAERFQEKLDDTSYQGISQAADEDLHVLEGLGRDLDKVDDCSAKNFLSAMPSLKRKRRKG